MPKVKEDYKKSRQQQILKAAYKCFNKKGYHNTSMRDIFKEVNLSSGAVYNYFSSKDEILQELIKIGQKSSTDIFNEVVENNNIQNPIKHILEYYFDNKGNKSQKLKGVRSDVSIWAAALVDNKVMNLTRNSYSESTDRITQFIEIGIEKGKIKADNNSKALALLLISIIEGLSIQKMLNPDFDMALYSQGFLKFIEYLEQ